jgi:nitrite reductase (NADH) small subunit
MDNRKKKEWQKVKAIDEVEQGASYVECNGHACFVVRSDDDFQVFDNTCPHKAAKIPCDAIDGMTLQCPMHQWRFNLENGECLEKGNQQPLNKAEFKIEGNNLYLFL